MEDYIVIGGGILGLYCTALLAQSGKIVLNLRADAAMASVRNQGWLQSGVYAALKGDSSHEDIRDARASFDWIAGSLDGLGHDKPEGMMVATSAIANSLMTSVPEPLDNFIRLDSAAQALNLGPFERAEGGRLAYYQVFDRPFPGGSRILNVLDYHLHQQPNVVFGNITPSFNGADIHSLLQGETIVLLCCGSQIPRLIGTGNCGDLVVKRTPLIATIDIPALKPNFLLDLNQGFGLVRHRVSEEKVLVWGQEFGLELDMMDLDCDDPAKLKDYEKRLAKFQALVEGYVGKSGVLGIQECIRIERRHGHLHAWQHAVTERLVAGIPGKASNVVNAASMLLKCAGVKLKWQFKSSDLDRSYQQYIRAKKNRQWIDAYHAWYEQILM